MPFEIPFAAKVILGIFLFQLALLWMALPFAIYGIKKRMQLAKEQRDEFLQELFWLRKTIETIPGASGVARRHSQKFMQELTEKAADEDEESSGGKKKKATKAKAAEKDAAAEKPAAKAKSAKKVAVKKSATVNRDNEPRITVPRPAASLLEEDDFDDDEEDPEEDYPDIAFENEPRAKKKAKKKATAEVEADDGDDYEDDSLDYLEEGEDSSHLLIDLPLKSTAKTKAQAMTNMVVEIPAEDEISEDDEGNFVYRGKPFDNLLDAMKQQQDDARKAKAS